jgi:hypothetical protein
MVELPRMFVVVALLAASCAGNAAATRQQVADQTTPTAAMATEAVGSRDSCPLTIPPQRGFAPPKPYPPQAPPLYQAVWYGTPALWTMLSPKGEVWEGLPMDSGMFVQKTVWWSDGYSWTAEPTPSITITGRQLDGPGSFEAGGPGTNGFRKDIGSFMLVGVGIPTAGCWELTARYRDAELTYVVLVEG